MPPLTPAQISRLIEIVEGRIHQDTNQYDECRRDFVEETENTAGDRELLERVREWQAQSEVGSDASDH